MATPPWRVPAAGYQPLVLLLAAWASGIAWDAWADPGLVGCAAVALLATGFLATLAGAVCRHSILQVWFPAWRARLARIYGTGSLATDDNDSSPPDSDEPSSWSSWTTNGGGAAWGTLATLILVMASGAAWHHMAWRRFPANDLARRLDLDPRPVCVRVELVGEPRRVPVPTDEARGWGRQLQWECVARFEAVRERGQWQVCSGLARLVVATEQWDAHCGDHLRLYGRASRPAPAANSGEFDVARAERAHRCLARLTVDSHEAAQVERVWRSWSGWRWLAELRDAGDRCLRRHVDERQASLASALLLGTREQLERERNDAFFVTGLAHLLAISGLNVAIFAYGFWGIVRLGWLPRSLALVLVAGLAVFYALLTGADPPVVRAAILVVCMCGAKLLARQGLAFNTLAAAGLVVLVHQPATLFQTGAQLSFLAVAVLAREAAARSEREEDRLEALVQRAQGKSWRWARYVAHGMGEAWATSARVWVVSLPLVAWRFHLVTPVALVINPLTFLPAAIALYAGFFVLVLTPWWTFGADAAGFCCGAALAILEWFVTWGREAPGGHFWTPGPNVCWVVGFYLLLAVAPLSRISRRWCWRGAWLAVGLLLSPWARESPGLGAFDPRLPKAEWSCSFIAVGHGTSVLVEWPDGRRLLYDGGRLGRATQGARSIAAALWSRGVTRIDALVISHADSDHFNAIPELLERFTVETVYVPPGMFRTSEPAVCGLRDALRRHGIVIRTLRAGDSLWNDAEGRIEVLHPPPGWKTSSDNAGSLVLSVERGEQRVLLPGDLEGAGLRALLEKPAGKWDVVMAPHHGSSQNPLDSFIQWARPDWVVVSGAASRLQGNGPGFDPSPARMRHTALDGMVRCEFVGRRVNVRTFWEKTPVRHCMDGERQAMMASGP